MTRSFSDLFVCLVILAVVAACSPRVVPSGPPSTTASLSDDRLLMADGAVLPLRVWGPNEAPSAVVLALHGFNDYSNAFDAPARFWAERGIVTYAYDQRGFGDAPHPGLWPGTETLTADLSVATRLIRDRYPTVPLFLIGESMGGAVIMTALAGDDPPTVDGVILSAPAVWARETMPLWQTVGLEMIAHVMPGLKVTGRGLGKKPSDNIEMLRALSRDPKVIKETRIDAIYGLVNLMDAALAAAPQINGRVLILYGNKEDIIPGAAQAALDGRLSASPCDIRFADYKSGYHMLLRDLNADLVLGDIVAWMAEPVAALPSGMGRPIPPVTVASLQGDDTATAHAVNCVTASQATRP